MNLIYDNNKQKKCTNYTIHTRDSQKSRETCFHLLSQNLEGEKEEDDNDRRGEEELFLAVVFLKCKL